MKTGWLLPYILAMALIIAVSPAIGGGNEAWAERAIVPISGGTNLWRCRTCHGQEKFENLQLAELGWDYIILREKYLRGADIPLSERTELNRNLSKLHPATKFHSACEWILFLAVISALLAFGAWGATSFLSGFGKQRRNRTRGYQ
jgi:hypothetical protein